MLVMASPVFKAMFSGSFEEGKTAQVTLTGKKVREVQWMLDYLYPGEPLDLTGKHSILYLL